MFEEKLLIAFFNGIIWGFAASLIAIGLTLIFGVLRIVNAAHGEFYMLGALVTWFITQNFNNFWLSLIIAPIVAASIGIACERFLLKHVEGSPTQTLIVTLGLMYIFQQIALIVFGGAPQRVFSPITTLISVFGYTYPLYRLIIVIVSIISLIFLWIFLYKTNLGLLARASQTDKELAIMMGVNVNKVYSITFGVGCVLAAIAGVLMAPIVTVNFLMGLDALTLAFIVCIVGGLGNVRGALIAGLILGLCEGIAATILDPATARVFSLLILCAILVTKKEL